MLGARAIRSHLLRATGLMHPEVVVFDVTHRCTSRCAGCAFRDAEDGELPAARWAALAREARKVGFREIVLTGGEPLAHPDIATILPDLARELPVSLMTNGLALRKHAALVREHTTRVFVSWDAASDDVYERIRGVRGLTAVRDGVRALAGHHAHARVTVWAENAAELASIREAARGAGCTEMSLLAADTSSAGFGEREEQRGTPPRADQLPLIQAFLESVRGDPFVVMSEYSRARLLLLASGRQQAPRCSAPWTSGVVDPTGHWRHCFFLESSADVQAGLGHAMRAARRERRGIDVAANPVCARCVCWRA
ncbi:MAG: radical SAM protein [Pseudomonadota bacterium]|nr:radical SAM protein [Pseudomonadota bacterium]